MDLEGTSRPEVRSLDGEIHSTASLNLYILGKPFPSLVDFDYKIASGLDAKQSGKFKVLGSTKPSVTFDKDSSVRDYAFPEDGGSESMGVSASAAFLIGFIPVTLEAGASATASTRVHAVGTTADAADASGKPKFRLVSEVEPQLRVDANGEAAIDAVFVKVGARVDLNLFELGVPMTFDISTTPTNEIAVVPQAPITRLHVQRQADLTFAALSGRVSLFAEICYVVDCDRFEQDIFRWEGVHQTTSLASGDSTVDLRALGWRLYGLECLPGQACIAP